VSESIPAFPARAVIGLAVFFGGGSLLLFGAFLFFGPLRLVDPGLSPVAVLAWDAALCFVFCVQHSVMVRTAIRRRVERIAPPHYYGAIYALVSAAALLVLILLWQESPVVLVKLEGAARWLARAVFVLVLPGFLWGARSIPQFDPLGVGPIKAGLQGREPRSWPFAIRGPYRWVRHPQYFFVLVLCWATPDLTADRLVLNGILTVWIVLGTVLEERDLVEQFGDDYESYRRRVPMLIPWRGPLEP